MVMEGEGCVVGGVVGVGERVYCNLFFGLEMSTGPDLGSIDCIITHFCRLT